VQGGGYKLVNGQLDTVRQDAAIQNEFHISNTRGTIAMAKQAGNPNSATNQWFFNEMDSNAGAPAFLDTTNGGFTVFGRIIDKNGLDTFDTLAGLPICNNTFAPPFEAFPLLNYDCVTRPPIQDANVVHLIWIKVVPQIVSLTRTNATTVHVTGRGAVSTTYKLLSSTTGATGSYTTSVNVTTGTQGNFNYDDTNAGTRKFYRVSIP
jgi:peptidyl-prolyl cis-trans isomerase A (cyclophilin A)